MGNKTGYSVDLKRDKIFSLQKCEIFLTVEGRVTPYNRAKNVSSESINLEFEFWSLEVYVNLRLSLYLLLGLYLTKPFPGLSEILCNQLI